MPNNQSKIDQLIGQLCPNGVQFKEVGKISELFVKVEKNNK